jgi:hypothetical protein
MNGVLPECLHRSILKKKKEIEIENNKFHKILYKMKGNPEYGELLGDIRFSGSPINPYSEMVEEALFNFQFSGALSRQNPDLVLYAKTPKFDTSYQNLIKGLSPDVLGKLDKFSTELLEKLT